ncbi:MAG: 2-succinyl-5-enolpyruvyl-6-hydroxy-3-cyclohexene-1-carboxylic-acid synthase [Vibrio sp.]
MKHDQAILNRIWSRTLLEELSRWGVEHVCAAPGSRSTPLILEADAHEKLQLHTHFDERGLGFMALGLAKATQQPVVVIVTSGTAVANLLPAIVESKLTGESLIVLSSDRPVELVGCGANQAIYQPGIFSEHVTHSVNLPSPNTQTPLTWLLSCVDETMHQQRQHGGSLHINCPYPEPLYASQSESIYEDYCAPIATWQASTHPYSQRSIMQHLDAPGIPLYQTKGLVVIGAVALRQAQSAAAFARKMGWPYLCDPQSGITSPWEHYDLWLTNPEANEILSQCEHIVQFGGRIVSKRLNQWLAKQVQRRGAHYEVVTPDSGQHNQSHLPQQRWMMTPQVWTAPYLTSGEATDEQAPSLYQGWGDALWHFADECALLATLHLNQDRLSEVAVALTLNEVAEQHPLFLGNSLMIRMIDMLSTLTDVPVYSNRGASGIDGLIATAAGVQQGLQDGLLVVIGDTALLHDLNSLALLHSVTQPMVVVVTNNDGGAIFDMLPVDADKREALYRMPHGYDFAHAAAQFGLSYASPSSLHDYQRLIQQHWESGTGALLVEVPTPSQEAAQHIQQLLEQVHAL